MIVTPLLLLLLTPGLALQEPEEPPKEMKKILQIKDPFTRLKALYAVKLGDVQFFEGSAAVEKGLRHEGRSANAPAKFYFRAEQSEERPRAALWDEEEERTEASRPLQIKTLMTELEAILLYLPESRAYVYTLDKGRFLPWQYIIYTGITERLEKHFDIEVIKDPQPVVDEKEKPPEEGDQTPRDGGSSAGAAGSIGPKKGMIGEDIFDLPYYILDLVPKSRSLRERVSSFTVWVDPKTCLLWQLRYTDSSGDVFVKFSEFKVVDALKDELFEIDLEDPKLKKVVRR